LRLILGSTKSVLEIALKILRIIILRAIVC